MLLLNTSICNLNFPGDYEANFKNPCDRGRNFELLIVFYSINEMWKHFTEKKFAGQKLKVDFSQLELLYNSATWNEK